LLKRYGILSIVDAVSSIGGEPLEADEWEPPGLTFMSISRDAWNAILKRKTPIIGGFHIDRLLQTG